MARPCGVRMLGFLCRVAGLSSAAAGGSGRALFERSEFSPTPPDASSARNPAGALTSAALLFGDFLLGTQEKVTALSGAHPDKATPVKKKRDRKAGDDNHPHDHPIEPARSSTQKSRPGTALQRHRDRLDRRGHPAGAIFRPLASRAGAADRWRCRGLVRPGAGRGLPRPVLPASSRAPVVPAAPARRTAGGRSQKAWCRPPRWHAGPRQTCGP